MSDSQLAGLAAVLAAGVLQGAFMLPMKWTRGWAWENTWLVFAFTAYLLCPWILVLSAMPNVFRIYGATSPATLAGTVAFGCGWGAGAVTFGLGVAAIGMALGFAVILGTAAMAGTLIPLLVLPHAPWTGARAACTAASLVLMLAGVAVCSFAGKWKEKDPRGGSYARGLGLCVVSGLLSSCGNLGFVFGAEIIARAQALGAPQHLAPNAVWALMTLALFVANAGYAALLLRRNRTSNLFASPNAGRYTLYGALMGVMWMGGFVFYGPGARALGDLGPSLGWALLMSTMVMAANLLGLLTGEWTGAPAAARRTLAAGLAILLAAIVGLGYSNAL
jgi:L-rhamnose-H+ transport protein